MTTDLVTWLRAQIDEDERIATEATSGPWVWEIDSQGDPTLISHTARWTPIRDPNVDYPTSIITACGREDPYIDVEEADQLHIAMWDPVRVLAEVKAKRAVLELHKGGHECSVRDEHGEIDCCHWVLDEEDCTTVLLLAQPYAGRDGWSDVVST